MDLYERRGSDLSLRFPAGNRLSVERYPEIAGEMDRLYYDVEAEVDWEDQVETNIADVLKSSLRTEAKAAIVYGSASRIAQKAFREFTEGTYGDVEIAVDAINHLLDEPGALEHLFQLIIHDYRTYTHGVHVFLYGSMLARTVFGRKKGEFFNDIGIGLLLHDIGKKEINPEILNKDGPLSPDEWVIVKRHPRLGHDLLSRVAKDLSKRAMQIVLQHHEWIDGSGYPSRLRGKQIVLWSKICSIANTYDGLTTNRPYRKAASKEAALTVMREAKGQFDQRLLTMFVKLASLKVEPPEM